MTAGSVIGLGLEIPEDMGRGRQMWIKNSFRLEEQGEKKKSLEP